MGLSLVRASPLLGVEEAIDPQAVRAYAYDAVASVRVEVRNDTRQLLVPHCPFCHGTHRYGAGSPKEPIGIYLGTRVLACKSPDYLPLRVLLKLVVNRV